MLSKKVTFYSLLTVLLSLGPIPPTAEASVTDYYWTGTDGSWNDSAQWSPVGPPGPVVGVDSSYAYLTFSDSIDRTISGIGPARQIFTGNSGPGLVYWNISEGNNYPGDSGYGVSIGSGTILTMTGGTLGWDVQPFTLELGATMNMSGGTASGAGAMSLSGILNLSGSAAIYSPFGLDSSGTLNQDGGVLHTAGATIYNGGIYNLTSGTVSGSLVNAGALSLLGGGTYHFGWINNSTGTINASGTSYFTGIYGLDISEGSVLDINGDVETTVYYDPADEVNDYLGGLTYNLQGGGYLMPVPEPTPFSLLMLALGVITVCRFNHRRKVAALSHQHCS
jgi:hypothetical protein